MNLLVDVFTEDVICSERDAGLFIPQLFSHSHTIGGERRVSALCLMADRIEISEYFCREIPVKLVTGIHVKPVIRTIGVISFVHLVNGVPVKKEQVAAHV